MHDRGERREGGDRARDRRHAEDDQRADGKRREALAGAAAAARDEQDEAADPDRGGGHVDEVGERDQRPQVARVERVAGQGGRRELEDAEHRDEERQRRDRDRGERRRSPDERDDRGGLDDAAEPCGVGGRLDREQPEATAGDQHHPARDHRGLQPPAGRLEQEAAGERGAAGDEHAREKEEAEDDRCGRRAAARGERRHGTRLARPDRERQHPRLDVAVVRDGAPAHGVRPVRQAGPERDDERAVVPGEPVCGAAEHRSSLRVDRAVAAGRADLVVEEELHVVRGVRQHGAVGRLRADQPRVGGRRRREGEGEDERDDRGAPEEHSEG